jgi:hypothetical protein
MSVVMDGNLVLDLKGSDGNAFVQFVLMSCANRLGTKMGFDSQERDRIVMEMQSSDYDNLVEVFTKYFGAHVKLLGR